jgi:Protein of unknown function (DUF3486)
MPKRAAIELLPEDARQKVNQLLIDSNFAGYDQLADQINGLLKDYDLELQISRSAIHRYGKDFQQRCEALRIATEQAKAIVEATPDDAGDMAEALQRLTQERLFSILVELEGDIGPKDLSAIARSVADINRTSVTTKKYAAEVKAKAQIVAQEITQIATKGGLSDDAAAAIRAKVLGIAA